MSAGAGVVLARTTAAEWSRLWTVRSAWFLGPGTALVALGVATLAAFSLAGQAEPGGSPWRIAQLLGMLALFAVLTMATVAATADHATGGIVPTLQWTPRRGVLLAARTCVVVLTSTLVGLALVAGAGTLIWLVVPDLRLAGADGGRALASTLAVYAAGTLLAVGLGLAVRSTAGALAGVFGLMLVLPVLLQAVPFDWGVRLTELLPGSGALFLMVAEGPGDTRMTTATSVVTLVVWALAALVAGGWRLLRTDADR